MRKVFVMTFDLSLQPSFVCSTYRKKKTKVFLLLPLKSTLWYSLNNDVEEIILICRNCYEGINNFDYDCKRRWDWENKWTCYNMRNRWKAGMAACRVFVLLLHGVKCEYKLYKSWFYKILKIWRRDKPSLCEFNGSNVIIKTGPWDSS